ncbi:MAG: carbonic anhydrase [Rickettsiales bacterium]|jgi:carbonic anhydrase
MPNVTKLLSGFRVFKSTGYETKKEVIKHLVIQDHKPSTMVISCVDLRIAPSEIFSTNPGDLYVVNNIGGLVPRYSADGVHGILAAIEHAVNNLEVENIIVLGHSKCDSIKTMLSDKFISKKGLSESMIIWLSIAQEARDAVKNELADQPEKQQVACEHESLVISLRHLLTYPYIKKRLSAKKLNIFAWHFDIETGDLSIFNPDNGHFESLS